MVENVVVELTVKIVVVVMVGDNGKTRRCP